MFWRNIGRRIRSKQLIENAGTTSRYSKSDLARFVEESDRLGGPGAPACEAMWREFVYIPTHQVRTELEPYGLDYSAEMILLYQEISGRTLDQSINEETPFDFAAHSTAANPYAHQSPKAVAKQMATLVQAIALAEKPQAAKLLDWGAGWGLSSETFAYVGYSVTAVDISARFVQLVNARAIKRGLNIEAVQSSFEQYTSVEKFDIAIFFECLHHALRPWELLTNVYNLLKPDGVLLLLAEPVQDIWWKTWGLRLDPLSVYCIKKYGWFESGFSKAFLFQMLSRAGFATTESKNLGNTNHTIFLCNKATQFSRADLEKMIDPDEVWAEHEYLVSKGDMHLTFGLPLIVHSLIINIWSFRPTKISITVYMNGHKSTDQDIRAGLNQIRLPYSGGLLDLRILSDVWCPNSEIGNSDLRQLSIHLASITGVVSD